MKTRIFTLAFAAAILSAASAQNVVGVSGPGRPEISVASHTAVAALVDGDAAAQEALKGKVISAAEGKALGTLAPKTVPIPFVGAPPVGGALKIVENLPVGDAMKNVGAKAADGARKLFGKLRKQR